jgi:hypothetical protein
MRGDLRGSENQQGEDSLVENRHKLPVALVVAFFLGSFNTNIMLSELIVSLNRSSFEVLYSNDY